MISFAILVSNEVQQFNKLLTHLIRVKSPDDEIVVVVDSSNTNDDIKTIVNNNKNLISCYFNPLDGDFSSQKNFLFSKCTKEYILNLDADEFITEEFVASIKYILSENKTIEAFWVPRWNEVIGITDDHLKTWRWKMDDNHRINWPDVQMRIVKNIPSIKWQGVVHERIIGYNTYAVLPLEKEYSIIHIKSIETQEKQNNFYNTLSVVK